MKPRVGHNQFINSLPLYYFLVHHPFLCYRTSRQSETSLAIFSELHADESGKL